MGLKIILKLHLFSFSVSDYNTFESYSLHRQINTFFFYFISIFVYKFSLIMHRGFSYYASSYYFYFTTLGSGSGKKMANISIWETWLNKELSIIWLWFLFISSTYLFALFLFHSFWLYLMQGKEKFWMWKNFLVP